MVFLRGRLPSTRDLDDGLMPTVVVVRQVDEQPLDTTLCSEETIVLLGLSYHMKGGKVFNPTGIRGKHIIKGFEAQDDTPAPTTNCEGAILKWRGRSWMKLVNKNFKPKANIWGWSYTPPALGATI